MLNKTQKEAIVRDLQARFAKKEMALFVSLAGVKVKTLEQARRKLKEEGSELVVVKKTFLSRVLKDAGADVSLKNIAGPFGVVFDYASQTQALKVLTAVTKVSQLSIVSALWRERLFEGDTLSEIALLPSLDVVRMRFLFLLSWPVRSLLLLLSSQPRSLLFLLSHYRNELPRDKPRGIPLTGESSFLAASSPPQAAGYSRLQNKKEGSASTS